MTLGSDKGVMAARGAYRARNALMYNYQFYGQGSDIVGTNPQTSGHSQETLRIHTGINLRPRLQSVVGGLLSKIKVIHHS